MKMLTEFPSFTLVKALATKNTLTAEGKTPEEIQTSLGETFKLEGEKPKYFFNALEVISANQANLKRVVIFSLNEGEAAPPKSVKFEDFHYVAEFFQDPKAKTDVKAAGKGRGPGGRGGGGRGDSKKGSPWGLSPEEKANKNKPATPKPAAN